jgi:hypothetical protein
MAPSRWFGDFTHDGQIDIATASFGDLLAELRTVPQLRQRVDPAGNNGGATTFALEDQALPVNDDTSRFQHGDVVTT